MPASLIIIAALTCFILWFRCFLLSLALGYDLQQQVQEGWRQPLIAQLWLVEAEVSCGLSLKGSCMSWAVLPCLKPLGGKRPAVWNMACPILLQWPVLFTPSNFVFPPSMKSSQPNPSHSAYSFSKGFYFWFEWLVMQRQVQGMAYHRQPCAWWCPTKSIPALLQCPFLLSH